MDGSNSAATHALLFPSLHNRCCKKMSAFPGPQGLERRYDSPFFRGKPRGCTPLPLRGQVAGQAFLLLARACHTTSTMSSTVPT